MTPQLPLEMPAPSAAPRPPVHPLRARIERLLVVLDGAPARFLWSMLSCLDTGRESAPEDVERIDRIALGALPEQVDAITFLQPYAGLVAAVPDGAPLWSPGLKAMETRKSRLLRSGPLVVCAGLGLDEEALNAFRRTDRLPPWCRRLLAQRGVALALVEVVGGPRPLLPEDEPRSWFYEPGRWCWELAWARPFRRPFPVRGRQGRFTVPRQLVLEALAPAPEGGR